MEALKAIVMFHTQSLFDRKMFVKMDDNSRARKEKLPDGMWFDNKNSFYLFKAQMVLFESR